jgi:hypothetical protein
MTRQNCKNCIYRETKPDGRLYCPRHFVWREPESMQFMKSGSEELCDFQLKVNNEQDKPKGAKE